MVSVTRRSDSREGASYSFALDLMVGNPGRLKFQKIAFDESQATRGSGALGRFPSEWQCPIPSPESFACLQAFLNKAYHPVIGYQQVDMTFTVGYEIENKLAKGGSLKLDINGPKPLRAEMDIRIRENRPYSAVWTSKTLQNSMLTRSVDGNSWTFDVNEVLRFNETYSVPNAGGIADANAVSALTRDPIKLRATWKRIN